MRRPQEERQERDQAYLPQARAVAWAIKPWPKKTGAANGARFVAGDCRAVLQLFRLRLRLRLRFHLGHVGFGIGTVFGVGDEAIAVAVHGREVEAGVEVGSGSWRESVCQYG